MSLTPFQQTALSLYPCAPCFAVVSWGCAATSWLARALNSHPDILCVHALNNFWRNLAQPDFHAPMLDGVDYLRIVASMGYAHRLAGDVHGVSRGQIPALEAEFGDRFGAAIVVREPMARLHSQFAFFDRWTGFDAWNLAYLDPVIEERQITLPADDTPHRMFLHGVNMLNAIVEERALAPVFRSEDLTTDAGALLKLVEVCSRGRLEPDWEWARRAVAAPRVNEHGKRNAPEDWADWQIDVMRRVVRPEAWACYDELGYARPVFAETCA